MQRLPDAELKVMQAVWDSNPPVARVAIEKIINKESNLATTTILTLLSRLVDRGCLSIEKQGRLNLYSPLVAKEDYLAAQSKSFFEKLCDGNLHVFASALCDSGLSDEDIEELRELLKRGEL